MFPDKPLPYSDEFSSAEEYIDALLTFSSTSSLFQILCGGVHILDFFTTEPYLFDTVLDEDWRRFLAQCGTMEFLDLLLRDDLEGDLACSSGAQPPESLVRYIRDIRRLSLDRSFTPRKNKVPVLQHNVTKGMNRKKNHEVTNFSNYVDDLVENIAAECGGRGNDCAKPITHLVDFGSGQNYLGRALSSPPYNRRIVAVEGREHNIAGAKTLDMVAGITKRPTVLRNKKLFLQCMDSQTPEEQLSPKAQRRVKKQKEAPVTGTGDFRSLQEIATEAKYEYEEGKGRIQYIVGRLESGDLSHIISKIDAVELDDGQEGQDKAQNHDRQPTQEQGLMAVSIHSCGNLSHFGIRSLILNPSIKAVAIVGCCYNLMTERLGPPTFNYPFARPSLQPLNGRKVRESSRFDPEGFPMSGRFVGYRGDGVRFNITARMMACQAPGNWTAAESDDFFTKHYFRAVLQKIFLDRGVVGRVVHRGPNASGAGDGNGDGKEATPASPFDMSTNPVILGSLRKGSYNSLATYVRAAADKLMNSEIYTEQAEVVRDRMGGMTDEEIDAYDAAYAPRRKEVAAMWSLMAFSAGVVEAMIVADRWSYLAEHGDVVERCWVETVFDYKQSPRNLVVVGIKK